MTIVPKTKILIAQIKIFKSEKISHSAKIYMRHSHIVLINKNNPTAGKSDTNTAVPLYDVPDKKNMSSERHYYYLTYRFDHKDKESFKTEIGNIRRILREAFNVWEKDTIMKFTETKEGLADIMISFEHPNHTHIDPYIFGKRTTGHAFQPGTGLGGDIHLHKDRFFDFNVQYNSEPQDGKISLYAVVLHEIGHSLGLGHTSYPDSVMYEFYSSSTSQLIKYDIRAFEQAWRGYNMSIWNQPLILPDIKTQKNELIDFIETMKKLEPSSASNIGPNSFVLGISVGVIFIYTYQ